MNKKAQILIVSLWILVILTVLAISIGHQVSLALATVKYQKNKFQSYVLAKTALTIAILDINDDITKNVDSLSDSWADNENKFKNISLNWNVTGTAKISYFRTENGRETEVFGVVDEQRKININSADETLLVALLEKSEVTDPAQIAKNILIWRGDQPDDSNIYIKSGYQAKKDKFSTIDELLLVPGINMANFQKIKRFITVSSESGRLNINTAEFETLSIFLKGLAKKLLIPEVISEPLAIKILEERKNRHFFEENLDIPVSDEESALFNSLKEKIDFVSQDFLIEVTGNASKIKSTIKAVYNRNEKKIKYWHET